MKNNIIYENEKLNCKPILICIIIVFAFVMLVTFRPFSPGFEIAGLLFGFGFMIFFSIIMFLMFCIGDIIKLKKFKVYKENFITKGTKLKGTIVDSEEEVSLYVNNMPSKYKYVAIIKVENGDVFKTPYLIINPNKCSTKDVVVYKKDEEYFASYFDYNFEQVDKKIKKETFKHIHSADFNIPSKAQSITTLIAGIVFCFFLVVMLAKAADNTTQIILIPFCIAGIGIFLQGLLPLVMIDKVNAIKISKRVYMGGFLLYWFGFLMLWDYTSLRDGQISLFVFSLIFWLVGIYLVKRWFLTK